MRAMYAGLLTIAIVASWQAKIEAAQPAADQTMSERSKALAHALKAEETVRTAIVNTIGLRTGTRQVPQYKRDCVKKADISFVYDIYATALAKTFTSQELDQALAFTNSPAGKLDATKVEALIAAARDPKASESLSEEDKDNLETLIAFAPTSAYAKLESAAYSTPEFRRQMSAKYEPIVMGCIAGPSEPAVIAAESTNQSMKFKHKCSRPSTDTLAGRPPGEKPQTIGPRMDPKHPPTSAIVPRGTLRAGERRTVLLELFVTEEGRVAEARVAESSGHSAVDQGAMKATEQWQMRPGTINGETACMWMKFATTAIEDGR
jgi:TonB family protein